jgi:hypothetical protein
MTANYIEAPAGALSEGIPADYFIKINGHKVRTTGTVTKIRRTGQFQIEVTLKHRRTGEIHVNTMDARSTVYVFAAFLQDGYTQEVQAGLPWEGVGEIWTESLTEQLRAKLKGNMWTFSGMPIEA